MDDPLADLAIPTARPSLVSSVRVPNVFPSVLDVPYRLAIVGEAPGAEEEAQGVPFVGASGYHLDKILAAVGVLRSAVFIGNVCKYRPPGNEIDAFGYNHPKVQEGWAELQTELKTYDPHCILALGNTPLHFLCNRTGVTSWRGSILTSPFGKVVPAIHPAACLREPKQFKLLAFDCNRARHQATFLDYRVPQRTLELNLSADEICYRLDNWPAGRLLSFDIEGGLDAFPCCSVAGEPHTGFIIAWSRHSDSDQGRIAVSLSRALYSTAIPKVLQNSLYDRFVLAYGYRMLIRNVREDTMDKMSSIYSELKKNLGMILSIFTEEPFYKFERKTDDQDTFYRYCIKDSCCTLEACLAMDGSLSPQERRYYNFSVAMKEPLLYMQLRGFRYLSDLANEERGQVRVALEECASRIEQRVRPMQWTKKEFSSNIRGEKGSISALRLTKVLYEQLGYPVQYKGKGDKKRPTADVEALLNLGKKKPGDPFLSDVLLHRKLEGVLETLNWKPDPKDGRMKCAYNQFSKGEDHEEEGGGATETGRLRCGQSIIPVRLDDGTMGNVGGNLQTVTKKLRRLYAADEGYWLFQCDLAGADGWTVAAHCLRHGDGTMWDDYMAGLKPAKIVALMLRHGAVVNTWDRAFLKEKCKEVDPDGGDYFVCKIVQHGCSYGMQEATMQMNVMTKSYKITGKPMYVEKSFCATIKNLFFLRYWGILQWHNWAKNEVAEGRNITSASGHTRQFFGRRKSYDYKTRSWTADHETWKEFLADEPQENTTYATNLSLHRLWNDPENRTDSVLDLPHLQRSLGTERGQYIPPKRLLIEPLHQVHDALIGQFPKTHTSWAVAKIREYFQNPLVIANTTVTIPFEGAYGPSWGELGTKYGGGEI